MYDSVTCVIGYRAKYCFYVAAFVQHCLNLLENVQSGGLRQAHCDRVGMVDTCHPESISVKPTVDTMALTEETLDSGLF